MKAASRYAAVVGTMMIALLTTGCVSNLFPGGPTPAGFIVTSIKSPAQHLTVATDAGAQANKTGTSSAAAFLGLFAFGDASVDAAMRNGGIVRVHHVDHGVNAILGGIWLQNTTIVHGD